MHKFSEKDLCALVCLWLLFFHHFLFSVYVKFTSLAIALNESFFLSPPASQSSSVLCALNLSNSCPFAFYTHLYDPTPPHLHHKSIIVNHFLHVLHHRQNHQHLLLLPNIVRTAAFPDWSLITK